MNEREQEARIVELEYQLSGIRICLQEIRNDHWTHWPDSDIQKVNKALADTADISQQQGQGEPVKTILRDETSAWQTQTASDGHPCVTCHTKLVGGVLCRWWGDGPIPSGVAMLDSLTSPPAPAQARELSDAQILAIFDSSNFVTREGVCNTIRAVIAADRAIRPAAGMVSDERSERVIEAAEKMRLGIRVWIESVPEYSMLAKNMQDALAEFDKAKQP